ncbi:transposase [Mesorhizobium sp. M1300]
MRRERTEAALRIQRLQLQIGRFNRKAFGRSSEKLGQMRLELEDLEADFAASVPDTELPIVAETDKVQVLPVRKLNPNLARKRVVREPSCACCPSCGGDLRHGPRQRGDARSGRPGLAGEGDRSTQVQLPNLR